MGQRKSSRSGLETRDRIIDAALETVRTEGLVGTSVRVIARTGGFNQALVFYHFGSVEELLLAALERANERRMVRFTEQLEEAATLKDLVAVALALHGAENDRDHPALAAIVAGWSSNSEVGHRIVEILKPWDDLVAAALRRSLEGTPFADVAPVEDMAHAISALFLGIELLNRLDGDETRTRSLFNSLGAAATVAEPMLDAMAGRSAVPEST
ncbi:MAG: TetR/AcrR family transcriptional regulator [Actinomycetota bacterium]